MTWANRLRLFGGLLAVLPSRLLTLVVNQRETQAFSSNATVEAVQYQVGSDYGGIMVDQYVERRRRRSRGREAVHDLVLRAPEGSGQRARAGVDDRLRRRRQDRAGDLPGLGRRRSPDSRPGRAATSRAARPWPSSPRTGTPYVEAQFRLQPVDYARIQTGAAPTSSCRNRQVVRGKVSAISVETTDGDRLHHRADHSPELARTISSAFAQPGSPVAVTLPCTTTASWPGRPTPSWSSCTGSACADAGHRSWPAVAVAVGLLAACGPLVHGRDGRRRAQRRRDDVTAPARRREADVARAAERLAPLVELDAGRCASAPLPDLRLAEGLTPPTNRWFSGLVFGDDPQPVFPLPLTFGMDDTAFGFGLPQIVTTATTSSAATSRTSPSTSGPRTTAVGVRRRLGDPRDAGRRRSSRSAAPRSPRGLRSSPTSPPPRRHSPRRCRSPAPATLDRRDLDGGTWAGRSPTAPLGRDAITLAEGGSAVFFPVPEDGGADELAELDAAR